MTTKSARGICVKCTPLLSAFGNFLWFMLVMLPVAASQASAGTVTADLLGAMPRPTLTVQVQPETAEIGQPLKFYIGAVVQGQVFVRGEATGWQLWAPGSPIPVHRQEAGRASHTIDVLDGSLDLSGFTGAKIYAGYGRSETEMLGTPGHLQLVYVVPPPGPAIGRYRLGTRGVWGFFERRGWSNGYYSGDMIRMFNQFDQDLQNGLNLNFPGALASSTVGAEVGLQLDLLRGWGINSVVLELRATDSTYDPRGSILPDCNVPPALGLLWPQPAAAELSNLPAFFDLAHSKGIRIHLLLNNAHMEEIPRTNAQTWLGAILDVVKDHPALDVVGFSGSTHTVDNTGDGVPDVCGIPAEPPLWLGLDSLPGQYVRWAIEYGFSLGIPARKLSAVAIVGDIYTESQPAGVANATDRHLWSPIVVLKQVFDSLAIPDSQRTYLISFPEHSKCATARNLPCAPDIDPHAWAEQTIQTVQSVVGNNGARIVAAEMDAMSSTQSTWPAERALESLGYLMEQYGIDGGHYWTWAETDNAYEAMPDHVNEPIKRRGVDFVYNPVQKELVDLAGFHLMAIANGSFESGGSTADNWTAGGSGTVTRFRLADEPGQPLVPTRGSYAVRLTTGAGASDAASASSDRIAVSPNTTYTTTANLRFQWTGDTNAGTSNTSRPQVYMRVRYFDGDNGPSAIRSEDTFRYYQESGSANFATFPITYTTPFDAMTVILEFGAMRNGLAQPITVDVDNVR